MAYPGRICRASVGGIWRASRAHPRRIRISHSVLELVGGIGNGHLAQVGRLREWIWTVVGSWWWCWELSISANKTVQKGLWIVVGTQ